VALLTHWSLPAILVQAVAHAGEIAHAGDTAQDGAGLDPGTRELCELTALAALAAELLVGGHADGVSRFEDAAMRHGLTAEAVDAVVADVQRDAAATASILAIDLPVGWSPVAMLDRARQRALAISLDTVMDLRASEQHVDELVVEANTDSLTGLANRRALSDFLERQVARRRRAPLPEALGVIMIDIDHFKIVNDEHGHAVGDALLVALAAALRESIRGTELLCRYGGEELCVVLPQTSPAGLFTAAERLRDVIAGVVVDDARGRPVRVTASLGGACAVQVDGDRLGERLIELADEWLYRAKRAGRNRTEVCPTVL
jgi:diguanylate cyclase (GGDEF)-like protein